MTDILSLPPEVQECIYDEVDKFDKKYLRLVCSKINAIVERQVFSSLQLEIRVPVPYTPTLNGLGILKDLSSGNSRLARHVRRLNIARLQTRLRPTTDYFYGQDTRQSLKVDAVLRQRLIPSILSLSNLESVHWTFTSGDALWTIDPVLDAISSLEIREFSLEIVGQFFIPPRPLFPLQRMRSLEVLSLSIPVPSHPEFVDTLQLLLANSPNLHTLSFTGGPGVGWTPLIDVVDVLGDRPLPSIKTLILDSSIRLTSNIAYLHHIRSLTTLTIDNFRGPQEFADVWPLFQKEGIALRKLTTIHINETLVSYLSSYTGLETLNLRPSPLVVNDLDASSHIDALLTNALPKHARSLTELLVLTLPCETKTMSRFSSLTRLASLTVRIKLNNSFNDTTALLKAVSSISSLQVLDIRSFAFPPNTQPNFLRLSRDAIIQFNANEGSFNPSFQISVDYEHPIFGARIVFAIRYLECSAIFQRISVFPPRVYDPRASLDDTGSYDSVLELDSSANEVSGSILKHVGVKASRFLGRIGHFRKASL